MYALIGMLAAGDNGTEIPLWIAIASPFVAACIERGVKLTLGSDTHKLSELGDFAAGLALLREAAACDDVQHLLYRPERRPIQAHLLRRLGQRP